MSHLKRFTHFCEVNKISNKEIEQKANLTQPKVYRYMNGETKSPGIDFAISISKGFPELSMHWWLLGEGEMIRGNEIDKDSLLKKEVLANKDKQIFELQQKLINFVEENELVKRIKELEAWKKETEEETVILYQNIEKMTEIFEKMQKDYGEMSE